MSEEAKGHLPISKVRAHRLKMQTFLLWVTINRIFERSVLDVTSAKNVTAHRSKRHQGAVPILWSGLEPLASRSLLADNDIGSMGIINWMLSGLERGRETQFTDTGEVDVTRKRATCFSEEEQRLLAILSILNISEIVSDAYGQHRRKGFSMDEFVRERLPVKGAFFV